jgi:hypothetical protein
MVSGAGATSRRVPRTAEIIDMIAGNEHFRIKTARRGTVNHANPSACDYGLDLKGWRHHV